MTPTSATGHRNRARRTGFTLIELLVTLTIVGLAAGAVVLTMPAPRPAVAIEAERFAARLVQAREEAVLTNRPVAVEVTATGYRFTRHDGADWALLTDGPFRPGTWSEGLRVSTGAQPLRMVFDTTGAADPARLTLSRDGRARTVAVDGAGEVTLDD